MQAISRVGICPRGELLGSSPSLRLPSATTEFEKTAVMSIADGRCKAGPRRDMA